MQSLDRVRSMTESERKSCVELRGELSTPLEHEERGRERKKGEEKGKERRIPANRTVRSCVILDCVEVGRDHRSIRTGQGNEGGLETVISKVHIYIYMVERTNSFVWSIVL